MKEGGIDNLMDRSIFLFSVYEYRCLGDPDQGYPFLG